MKGGIVIVLCLICSIAKNVQAKTFIVNGQDVPLPGMRPFYAYIEMYRLPGLGGDGYFGGGSLISPRAILTVAQNVAGFLSWRVGLGGVRIADFQLFDVESQHVHSDYNASSLAHNIAVLRLSTTVLNSPNIIPINRIPEGSTFPTAGASGFAIGFGFGATNVQPNILQEALLTVLSTEECSAAYPHLNAIGQLENHFCAQNIAAGSNVCAGDQGGPIFSPATNLLFGIQSFNRVYNCSLPESQPAAFIRVTQYASFINQFV